MYILTDFDVVANYVGGLLACVTLVASRFLDEVG